MINKIKPKKLRPNDKIGIISPSWGGGSFFPHRIERGIRYLETHGFDVKIGTHAMNSIGYVSDTAKNRVEDIHSLFLDPEVKAVISSIGGDHSCQLLPLLDFNLIKENPKIFMGFSDISVLNNAIWKMTGMITFNGPAIMTDFGEYPELDEYTSYSVNKTLTNSNPIGEIIPSDWWSEEILDWGVKADLTRARKREISNGWKWLKRGSGKGILIGGCLESMEHLRGTKYWPDMIGSILFLETSEEKPSPAKFDGLLCDYLNMGIFEHIEGLLIGRCFSYTNDETSQIEKILLERLEEYSFPIITRMDFGHTIPQFVLPIGCEAKIDGELKKFSIIESAVID